MKKDKILNPEIISQIAMLGHTEYIGIADCGLPVPKGVKVVDVSVTAGIPKFLDVLKAVSGELVIESIIVASEIDTVNPKLMEDISSHLENLPVEKIPHEEFKKRIEKAK